MGGMFFGWDSGLIGGVLSEPAFQKSFGLSGTTNAKALANLKGNIVSMLQAGCFFGAVCPIHAAVLDCLLTLIIDCDHLQQAASLYFPDRFGRKKSLIGATFIFIIGSIIQSTCKLGSQSTSSGLSQLYAGRFIGGFGTLFFHNLKINISLNFFPH